MKYKIIPNPDKKIYEKVTEDVKACHMQCPCFYPMDKDDPNKRCICKDFKDAIPTEKDLKKHKGLFCHCLRFKKIVVEED